MIEEAKLDPSPLLEFSLHCTAEWRSPQHNVLLEGSEMSTAAVLRVLAPHLRPPVTWIRSGAPFDLPYGDVGALILQDVDALCAEEQERLLSWIDARPAIQIVSTTAESLFALVARGRFDAALYYRLNVVLLNVDPRHDFGFHAGVGQSDPFVPYGGWML
jgi:sigma-54-interacting transcriptional regulator